MARKIDNGRAAWGGAPEPAPAVERGCPRARPRAAMGVHRLRAFGLILLCAVFVFTARAPAQVSKEYQLKAVFLWRLAQFTQWPGDAFETPESPIAVCVFGDNPFGDALNAAVAGETAHGRKLVVQRQRTLDQMKSCHIVFVSPVGPRQARDISAAVAGRSILTVADGDGLPNAYDAMIRFLTEQNKIKLRIHLKPVAAARLVLDPRLLRAAEIVND